MPEIKHWSEVLWLDHIVPKMLLERDVKALGWVVVRPNGEIYQDPIMCYGDGTLTLYARPSMEEAEKYARHLEEWATNREGEMQGKWTVQPLYTMAGDQAKLAEIA